MGVEVEQQGLYVGQYYGVRVMHGIRWIGFSTQTTLAFNIMKFIEKYIEYLLNSAIQFGEWNKEMKCEM